MALAWFLLVLAAAVVALAAAKRRSGARRAEQSLAYSLAVVERACTDAVAELCRAAVEEQAEEDPFCPAAPRRKAELYVNPFDPATVALTRISDGDLAALGGKAAAEHRRLVTAINQWNAAAGTRNPVERLLPTILAAHEAAQELARLVERHHLDTARRAAEARILLGLVAFPPSDNALVN